MPPGEVSSRTELEELTERVKELESRLAALEHPGQTQARHAEAPPESSVANLANVIPGAALAAQTQANVFSVFGKAVLGIAGAYVLRAIAESAILPSWIAVTVALLYAAAWLVWAAWSPARAPLARNSYAITASLILFPLLWEATVRFQMLAPPVTAAVLVAFVLLAVIVAGRTNFPGIAWVGVLTAVFTAIVLMVATSALVPFAMSLLAMALLTEFAAFRDGLHGLRPIVAAGADFAVLIVVLILGNPAGVPANYQPASGSLVIALAAALFLICATTASIRSLAFRATVKTFETAQLVVALLLMSWAVLRVTDGTGRSALGAFFLAAGAACYFVAFGLLARHRERPNFIFYGVCGLIFILAGSFLALASLSLVIWLCLASLGATGLGINLESPALDLHGVAYLAGAAIASGLLGYAGRALAGAYPHTPGALPMAAAAAALVCAAMISRYPGEHPSQRSLRLLPAILAVYAVAALTVAGLVWAVAHGAAPTRPQLAVIRTIVTCAAVLLLAFIGARWTRRELVWIAYATAVLGSLKLLLEDLRFGTTQSLAASLLIYGAVLILIPRLARPGKRPA
jgi:hypothetical protein